MVYKRNLNDLEDKAVKWWPESLSIQDKGESIIPKLLESQDKFLSILNVSDKTPFKVVEVLRASGFPINLFVKHLCVLADYGGEPLQRLGSSFEDIFPLNEKKKRVLEFVWNGRNYEYEFKSLPVKGLSNKKLKIDAKGLDEEVSSLNGLYEDVIMILLHGASSQAYADASLSSCEIGALLGKDEELNKYVKERYILVSRITGGATANSLGQLAQKNVVDFLSKNLGDSYNVKSNGLIVLDGYDKKNGMPFDVVVEKNGKYIGIEISFQVTTNSTIERKSGQAADRKNIMNKNGYHIAYILDGAGNFNRRSALSTICNNSECTVAYSEEEFEVLCEWIRKVND